MTKPILFIQGGGEDGYTADATLADSLRKALGHTYPIHYPEIIADESLPDFGWTKQLARLLTEAENGVIIVGHSFGAAMLLKYLSENSIQKKIAGIFLLAPPFWNGDEDWQKELKLTTDFAIKLPAEVPIFLYHCEDDEEVPFSHFTQYKQMLPQASFRATRKGGHQFNNNIALVADDIKVL